MMHGHITLVHFNKPTQIFKDLKASLIDSLFTPNMIVISHYYLCKQLKISNSRIHQGLIYRISILITVRQRELVSTRSTTIEDNSTSALPLPDRLFTVNLLIGNNDMDHMQEDLRDICNPTPQHQTVQ